MDWSGRGESSAAPAQTHLVGVAGRGMFGLAEMLARQGVAVTASGDAAGDSVERLRRLGVRVHAGHAPRHCPRTAARLIYGSEIGRDHPERLAAARRGIVQESALDWLGRRMSKGVGLVVAGGRQGSAAAAMIAWILTRAGLDPSAVLGRSVPQLGGWARLGEGPHFVVEALDLADGLGPLAPKVAVVLDREAVHGEARTEALRRFVSSVPADGFVLGRDGDGPLDEAVRGVAPVVERLSLEHRESWWGGDLREDRGRCRFRAFHRGRFVAEVMLQVPGHRNVLGALAAVAVCRRLEVATAEIKEGLEEFAGVSRDFESRGSYRGVTLVDDAGGEGSSVAETLAVCRQVFGGRRLWAVLGIEGGAVAPDETDRFAAAFAHADFVRIAGGSPSGAEGLARSLAATGVRARWSACLDDLILELDRFLEPGDLLVTLGAGAVGTIADAFIRRLPRDRQGR